MRRIPGRSLLSLTLSIMVTLTPIARAMAKEDARPETRTPIWHVIVVIGENRSYDHVFATYVPKANQRADNLRAKGIVNADGTPGPNFAAGAQFTVPPQLSFYIGTANKTPYTILPPPDTLGAHTAGSDTNPPPFATLAAAAAVTTRLRIGSGVCLVPERDPLLTAHQVATVDWLSGGRFLFGIGAGWLREEMGLFTPHFEHRFAFMREAVAAMRKLWTEDAPSFEGRWVRFPPVVCRPRPVQRPHPPVILGGMGPNAVGRVAAWGDGWMPIALPPDDLAAARREIDRLARDAGRDPARISLTVMIGAPPGLETPALDMLPDRAIAAAYADARADRVVVSLPTLGRDEALRHLDRVAQVRA